jgi:hypothetical protein
MGLSELFPREWGNKSWTPGDLARFLVYTPDTHRLGGGLIIWGENRKKFNQLGIEFIGRYYGDSAGDLATIKNFSKHEDHFVILEVSTKSGGRHWLHVIGPSLTWRGMGFACNDPWDGKRLWKTTGWLAPYVRIKGYAIFKRNTL